LTSYMNALIYRVEVKKDLFLGEGGGGWIGRG